jgi:very-short-patch-repair endonuclease
MEIRHRIHPVILAHAREMRHPQTPAEATLWHALRNRKTGFKFRRQHPIDRFIIDFYCAKAKLLIEVDGKSHLEPNQKEYDQARTEYLEKLGYKVIRFTNNDVKYNIDAVANNILRTIETRIAELKASSLTSPHPGPLPIGERGKDWI